MNFFLCLVRVNGAAVTAEDRRLVVRRLASRGIDAADWVEAGSFCALVRRSGDCGPRVARAGTLIGVGDVRFDNPAEIAARLPDRPAAATHLELALQLAAARGSDTAAAAGLLGDFAYVTWDAGARRLTACRDAFGVRPLFHAKLASDLLAFSSHASLLGTDAISDRYIARYFVRSVWEEDTIFDAVEVFPAAHTLRVSEGRWDVRRYWSPELFDIDSRRSKAEAIEEFRTLFAEAVRLRLRGARAVWSELSGGLDTSAVVSTAAWLHRAGNVDTRLAGTITYTDALGAGDERAFVSAVVDATSVRNEQIVDTWPWRNDGGDPLHTEQPGPGTLFWCRDRQRNAILQAAGADVLLSGLGGDHLLEGTLDVFADRLAAGAIGRTCREMVHWAALEQTSFWTLAYRHGLVPLRPVARGRELSRQGHMRIPTWVDRGFRQRADLDAHLRQTSAPRLTAGALPRYRADNVDHLDVLPRSQPRHQPCIPYERRFPFLYRPLVELTLRLPPELKMHPVASKVALREAMRGILPERVRTRLGKGGINARMLWALNHEHRLIERLLRDPLLAQMGYVDAARLREAYDATRTGRRRLTVPLFNTLALETWLLIETGRWSRLDGVGSATRIATQKEHRRYGTDQEAVSDTGTDGSGFRCTQDDGDQQGRMLGRQSDERQRQPAEVQGRRG